jgi:hypothetical protein
MANRSAPHWQPTITGWSWGRYDVIRLGPGRWALDAAGSRVSTHGRASDAAAAANVAEQSRRRTMKIVRNALAFVIAAVILVLAQAGRTVPNTAYDPALLSVGSLEDAYRAVVTGEASMASFTDQAGVVGDAFVAQVPFEFAGITGEPRDYRALVASYAGECYAVRWHEGGTPFAGVLEPEIPCEPSPSLIYSSVFQRGASQSQALERFNWGPALPPESYQARWFLPVMLAGVFVMLQSVIGIALVGIRPPRRAVPRLDVSTRMDGLRAPTPASP